MKRRRAAVTSDDTPRPARPAAAKDYSATAVVFVGNKQFVCRATSLSVSGILLFPRTRCPKGTFMRVNLCLPGFSDLLDLDCVIERETSAGGYYAWRVKFHEPSATERTLIQTYAAWNAYRKLRKTQEVRSPTASHPTIRNRMTGPHLPRIKTGMYPAVSDRAPEETMLSYQRRKQQAEVRRQERTASAKAKKELRDLYKAALNDMDGK